MYTTEKTVTLLKTIAIIAGLAIIMWSLGLPSLRFADAAAISDVSDTLSDSAPSASADHTISFVSPTGVATSSSIVIDFVSDFSLAGIGEEDIDLLINGSNNAAANWSVATTATEITITLDNTSIAGGATTTIRVGTHATSEGSPDTQIVNPGSEGSYVINFTVGAGGADTGSTRVVILNSVQVSAAVETIFTFAVAGLPGGTDVNSVTTTGSSTATEIPFGTLVAEQASTTGQRLTVNTNASNGYVVTVQLDQPLQSSTGAIIDGFEDGSNTNVPVGWDSPAGTIGSANTYGHWGITSEDDETTRTDQFGVSEYVAASTTAPIVVMSHTTPVNGTGPGQGTTDVGYTVEISPLQEAGDDYTATLTYVATPTF